MGRRAVAYYVEIQKKGWVPTGPKVLGLAD